MSIYDNTIPNNINSNQDLEEGELLNEVLP